MIAGQGSRTAQYVALFRALESRRSASERLFDDPFAEAFLDPPLRVVATAAALPGVGRLVPWILDRRVPGPRPSAIARTRYIDDALREAMITGTEQVVILGAGFDSRAYRMPELAGVRVFEVDHPDTQAVKRKVMSNRLGALPENVSFVAVDFEHDPVAPALSDAGLVSGCRTFTIWEGVASYLTRDAVDATFRWTSDVVEPGSELVFTYVHRGLLDGSRDFPDAEPWVRRVADAGEPFVLGFTPEELGGFLPELGWRVVDDITTPEALSRYGLSTERVPAFYRIALLSAEAAR